MRTSPNTAPTATPISVASRTVCRSVVPALAATAGASALMRTKPATDETRRTGMRKNSTATAAVTTAGRGFGPGTAYDMGSGTAADMVHHRTRLHLDV